MVTNTLLGIEFIKVVNTEILIGFVIAEHDIDSHQQAVLDRADGPFFSTPARQTMVLSFKIAVFGTCRRVRYFGQYRVEVAVGRGGFAAAPFTGTFMVTRTAACPRGKVLVARGSTHVSPRFRQQRPSPPPTPSPPCHQLALPAHESRGATPPPAARPRSKSPFRESHTVRATAATKNGDDRSALLPKRAATRESCREAGAGPDPPTR